MVVLYDSNEKEIEVVIKVVMVHCIKEDSNYYNMHDQKLNYLIINDNTNVRVDYLVGNLKGVNLVPVLIVKEIFFEKIIVMV